MVAEGPGGAQSARCSPSEPGNAFLEQGHLIGSVLLPSWCYALLNPKVSLKICSTQCVSGTWGKECKRMDRARGLSGPERERQVHSSRYS